MVLCRNVLEEDDILCELYVDTSSDVSDYSDNESLDSDSDILTTSSRTSIAIFYCSTDPTISTHIFPHIYQDNFCNNVRLVQTLLERNVRVYGTRRANRGIPHDLEGEGKRLEKGKSAFGRNGV
jgi:hypothetical protein